MRTFITLEFDRETKEEIIKIQKFIRQNSISGRFKYIDNFHLTLKFLGETDMRKIDLIYNDLVSNLNGVKEFKLTLNGIGVFGIGKCIKTIFIKTIGSVECVEQIAETVDKTTLKYGFEMERSYTPHVTIAQNVELNIPFNELAEHAKDMISREVLFDRVVIMKSEQIGNRRIYTPIKNIILGK